MKKRLPACQTDGMMTYRHYEGADSCRNFLNGQWIGQFFILAASRNRFHATGSGRLKCSIAEAAFDIAARKAQKYLPGTDVLSFSLYGGKYFEDVLFHTFSPRCMSRKRVATPRHRRQQDARICCKIFHVALALGRYIERYSLPLD